ncbi:MAG: DUF6580 family putative transport protein [Candidatus Thermoplasmatota archaeon]
MLPEWLRFERRDVEKAIAFIVIGVVGRLLLLDYANIEPVLALSLLAGMVLPLALAAIVPVAMMAITDYIIYAYQLKGSYGLASILGLTFFVYTGFLMATLIGRRLRNRYALRIKNMGIITFSGVIATLVFDLWTDLGVWYFFTKHTLYDAQVVLVGQVSFTLVHIASTIIFVPLFGSGYLLLTEHRAELDLPSTQPAPND